MKKVKIVFTLLVVFLLFSSNSFAASKYSYTTMNFDGRTQKVRTVPVLIDGKSVSSDIPSFIYKDSTLVPVRFVANGLGAEVKWNQKNKTVTVIDKGKEVVLGIESPNVYINGQKQKLPKNTPPPKLVNDSRTMVPIRFISETLGYSVAWDNNRGIVNIKSGSSENEAEINNISIETETDNLLKIKISGSSSFKYEKMNLEYPPRLVIDIPNSKLNLKNQGNGDGSGIVNIPVGQDPIKQISTSQFSVNPNVTRVVIHLTEDIKYNIDQSGDGKNLEISFPTSQVPSTPVVKPIEPVQPTQPVKPVQPSNKFLDIKIENVNGEDAIVIYNSTIPKTNNFKMTNPNRMVIDILDSTIDLDKQKNYNYDLGIVKGVRVSQFSLEDKIVRAVIDIKDGVSKENVNVKSEGNRIIIIPEKNAWEGIDFSKVDSERKLIISALNDTNYSVNYDSVKKTMEIMVPLENVKLNNGTLNIGDNLIDNIVIGEELGYKKVVVNFKRSVIYNVISREIDNKIAITFVRNQDVSPSERLIAIDPGHGGSDPGACYGAQEKEVTISISHKLNDRLKSLGYNTIMTRSDDSYKGLYERTDIANNNNADIFISIHSNANNNRNASGLETLYHPSKSEGDGSSLDLAKMIQEEVIKTTGFKDRSIVERPKLAVLRTSHMPAALIEVGFISNQGDQALITNSEFQDKVVDGIVKAIERYFKEY
ncbi:N-acetylmuramoyl-L-alanine amidase family protein [Anaerosalibacter sp. Marseille-P3206]|uniref:N-acetylmuramoyl-L-alanine amidase family protein n=1 Tax=Anaerosalibacter sp. Marseille-P3206 TaxID=1871005 RepID=UPI00098418FC|nr:N-acetylmuramoyl-L-alanine amidase family protein [Anaerosalibacter sp. Marseille-P3206]